MRESSPAPLLDDGTAATYLPAIAVRQRSRAGSIQVQVEVISEPVLSIHERHKQPMHTADAGHAELKACVDGRPGSSAEPLASCGSNETGSVEVRARIDCMLLDPSDPRRVVGKVGVLSNVWIDAAYTLPRQQATKCINDDPTTASRVHTAPRGETFEHQTGPPASAAEEGPPASAKAVPAVTGIRQMALEAFMADWERTMAFTPSQYNAMDTFREALRVEGTLNDWWQPTSISLIHTVATCTPCSHLPPCPLHPHPPASFATVSPSPTPPFSPSQHPPPGGRFRLRPNLEP